MELLMGPAISALGTEDVAMFPMWFLCAVSSVTVIYLFALAGSGRDHALPDSEDFRMPGR
jgi:hypothetical protein